MFNYIAVKVNVGNRGGMVVSVHPFTCIFADLADGDDDIIIGDVAKSLGIEVDPNSPTEGVFIFHAPQAGDTVPEVIL